MGPPLALPDHWPRPADEAAAERLIERFAALGAAEARLAGQGRARAMLAAIGGNSPYLADLALREAATLRAVVQRGPDPVVAAALAELGRISPAAPGPRIAAALRRAKRQIALTAALADIGGLWSLEEVTGTLSDLADAALRLGVAHLLRAAHEAADLRLPDPAQPAMESGLVVLGMGKLGSRELNYSSDIDLILLYDPASHPNLGDAAGRVFTRFARDLVALMQTRDADGYVFRTDLRLRPDPAATPPALSLPAALTYYESMGQNWERAAMIRARPVAGDLALGSQFLEAIRPFIWRRHLDFAAIADIRAMKQRIDAERGSAIGSASNPVARIAGHDVKLGEGGIREIEFLVQTLQLVWGGRNPALREPRLEPGLRLLARAGHLPREAAAELGEAYRFLRGVEHRLQMINDRQVHSLPSRPPELERFAVFMGYADATAFATALLDRLARVRGHFVALFDTVAPTVESDARLDFSGVGEPPPATVQALRERGFHDPAHIVDAVRRWQTGRVRALRSERARDLMADILPLLLAALARQADPDIAFAHFDAFLSRQPAGVQLLSLLQRNPPLLEQIAALLGGAPGLAEHLASVPSALEGLLAGDETDPDPRRALRVQLHDARALEDAIEITRRFVRGEEFRLSAATLEGRVDIDAAGERRTALADAAIGGLLPLLMREFAQRNGRVRGGGLAVVALGKAGAREMLAGSDLDLMLVYDHPETVSESTKLRRGDATRRLPASQYFIRAAHAMVAALTAPGLEGPLYAVDMRLRPSGNKGPVAVSLRAFERYHQRDSWTWERMALTRARVVAGPPRLRERVAAAIRAVLVLPDDPARIREDAATMRLRVLRDLPAAGPWDVKLRPGGLMDVEFIAQVLQLVHGPDRPALCHPTTHVALARLGEAGVLAAAEAARLIAADRTWRTVQGLLRITLGRPPGTELPEAATRALLRAPMLRSLGGVDPPGLRATLDALAADVRAAFSRHIGDVWPAADKVGKGAQSG
ncbi:MAG TPA: bifunctional [glutamine synthetase] adenylyltransferase/[glutamine synthetase]-adenylyl-L-tyrosine phosphorylase [Acetobacteraceae bacterium]|nr:bifunctional [glutamine synthetase] adenylyltransferase/[glutamine synthetase]-adenylyl-L-tyrosine phosphorylase [Acetobacteraceae bacterium]